MRVAWSESRELVPEARRRDSRELGTDAADRRAVSGAAILWLAADDRLADRAWPRRQSQAGTTPHAADGPGSDLSQAATLAAWRGSPDLPVFTAKCRDSAAQPGVEQRHHLRAAGQRLCVPDGGARLVQPLRAVVGTIVDAGWSVLS